MALNPIAFTEQVVADFLRYQLTTYPLADVDLHAQMRALLRLEARRDTPLRRGPFISLSKPFREGASLAELVREGVLHPAMPTVAPFPSLRAHQDEAIRAIHEGRTTLVATGTGSGKTEAFLFPIISRCLELLDAGAPPGIVAVLVYPMNALAEDQLDRLRALLAGRGIPFGMYVGKTPDDEADVKGERMPSGSSNADYRARLAELRTAGAATTLLPAEERASRAAMQRPGGQPRILLTNVKQLELLLTRGKDIGLFARAPLEFLVFDEAHTFRGAQGAETACLIRRLRSFCGREASEVTCVATSATIADPKRGTEAGRDFARRFFGVDGDRVTLVTEAYESLRWDPQREVPAGPADPAAVLARVLAAVDLPGDAVAAALSECLLALGGGPLPSNDWQSALAAQLRRNDLVFHLASLLDGPRSLTDLPSALTAAVGRPVSDHEVLTWLALGVACARDGHDPVLRPVVHSFIRGVGGAVVTLSGLAGAARLWLAGDDVEATLGHGWQRFPLLTCTTCGQHYYETWLKDFRLEGASGAPEGGDLVDTAPVWPPLAESLGGARALFVDRLVVKPDEDEDDDPDDDVPAVAVSAHDFEHGRLHPLWACRRCGALHGAERSSCGACHQPAALVPVQVVRSKRDLPGVLHSCVACQAPGRRPAGGRYREPARPVRAVSVSDVHVLAQSMLHLAERPRLLVFADNRQDAAFQAGWMRDHARRFRLRALMSQAIPTSGASIGDVTQHLSELLERDRDLSEALIPEVWRVAPPEDASTKHREERLYFLRLQVLREVATGVKQRLGLEPWGRLRVEYLGLDAKDAFFREWAPKLGTDAGRLVEGVGALLDHLRRSRLLHDASTRLYGRQWGDGDKEIQYGYFPQFAGGPRGMKRSRAPQDSPQRVVQWVGERPGQVATTVTTWGVPDEAREAFLDALWNHLVRVKLLVLAPLEGWGKALRGSAGTWQIDAAKLVLTPHCGRWRCDRCRRTTVRVGPKGRCGAWRCAGTLEWEVDAADDFDLHMLDGDYAMLRVAEHSAQVPEAIREQIENRFKGQGEHLNTLVCTPTLELGVDIGALDAVLMRNVPPSAANYWQRAGRAGRRHRMAVDITYAQATGFDQSYFRDPLKLLAGVVDPPRFNLQNDVMIRKHVHATVLTALHGLTRRTRPPESTRIEAALSQCFPRRLGAYLFSPAGMVLSQPTDVSVLADVLRDHRAEVDAEVARVFTRAWPAEDARAVDPARLAAMVMEMPGSLAAVLARFKRRLDWARGELDRLSAVEARKGALDVEDAAHRKRCSRVIERLKGKANWDRARPQGGADDSDTMGALAREGFLPGYGLESGSITGTAEPPRMTYRLDPFPLSRSPTLALREFVPGNAIYANGFRFVPRHFLLTPEEALRFRVDAERQRVQEVGSDVSTAALGAEELRAVPVCDAILPSQSHISDEEDFRFQMPVAVYAMERDHHRGGTALSWSGYDLRLRRAVQLRMVNAGPRAEVSRGALGYPICLACGQSQSPYTSTANREKFRVKHEERCGHAVRPTGFFADVEVDVLGLHGMSDRTLAFSVLEALRMGAARVLDMEVEDLQLLAIGQAQADRVDVLLYDPMPGGSGLLDQLVARWGEVRASALALVEGCPGACDRACIDCLQTYRNRFYHPYLDRHEALAALAAGTTGPELRHEIPEQLPRTATTTGQPQTVVEQRFQRLLRAAGLPSPEAQHRIGLGGALATVPDFFYVGDDPDEPGICIYIDGMAGHLHGNAAQADHDRYLRERLRSKGYEVVVLAAAEVDDRKAMVMAVSQIARYLVSKERGRALREDTRWFDGAAHERARRVVGPLRLERLPEFVPGALPVIDLRVAAGRFAGSHLPDATGYVRLEGIEPRDGMFVARVTGDSMNLVVPDGAWCLWEHLGAPGVAAPASGEALLMRRVDGADPESSAWAFKVLVEAPGQWRLEPRSDNPAHLPVALLGREEVIPLARFVALLDD